MADREDPTTVDRSAPVDPTTSSLDEMVTRGRTPAGLRNLEPVTQSGIEEDAAVEPAATAPAGEAGTAGEAAAAAGGPGAAGGSRNGPEKPDRDEP